MASTLAYNHYDNLLIKFFSNLKDPRHTQKGNLRHNLLDIIFLVVSAVISGSEDWENIVMFGENQLK